MHNTFGPAACGHTYAPLITAAPLLYSHAATQEAMMMIITEGEGGVETGD